MRLFFAALLPLAVSSCALGQTYTIQTFAGGGLAAPGWAYSFVRFARAGAGCHAAHVGLPAA